MIDVLSRRELIARGGLGLAAAAGAGAAPALAGSAPAPAPAQSRPEKPFLLSLNTGTIRGQKLSVPRQIEVAAEAGYDGIEPWIGDLQQYADAGGSLEDLKKKPADLGLSVMSAIGFAPWLADDGEKRAAGVEQLGREMELIARAGGRWIAAPPAGATGAPLDPRTAGERYRAVLELGEKTGVTPQLEIWGSSKTLSRIGEAAYVAAEAGHPKACLLLDAYHIYKGGSDFAGLRLLNGAAMHAFHVNDYPADPPRETISDAHRVYPGDGVAPLTFILRTLFETGFRGYLSLELFNRDYWKQDALEVARTGIAKIRSAVERAMRG